jgi:hypothetical protein
MVPLEVWPGLPSAAAVEEAAGSMASNLTGLKNR